MTNLFESKDYKKSREFYTAQCAFEYFIFLPATDAFLAKLLKDIGLSDATAAVLSSLISLTFCLSFCWVSGFNSAQKTNQGIQQFPVLVKVCAGVLIYIAIDAHPTCHREESAFCF